MTQKVSVFQVLMGVTFLAAAAALPGQVQTTQPAVTATATPSPTSAPAKEAGEGAASLTYEVIAVEGKVRSGPTGLNPDLVDGWRYVQVGDQLVAGTQVSVPFRGRLKLVARPADPATVLFIEPSSLINISELSLDGGTAKSRIELGYGAIRAGVAEGTSRSDMQIQCPVATLSKRGTDIFRFEYYNGRFVMSLSDQGRGMIQAIQMQSTAFGAEQMRSRFVTAGQFVTHQMLRAIDTMQFERQININDLFGVMEVEQLALAQNQSRFGFVASLGSGNTLGPLDPGLLTAPETTGGDGTFSLFVEGLGTVLLNPPVMHSQNAGDFGIGQGRLPSLFGLGKKAQKTESKSWTIRLLKSMKK